MDLPQIFDLDKDILNVVTKSVENAKYMQPSLQNAVAKYIDFTASPVRFISTNDEQLDMADQLTKARGGK